MYRTLFALALAAPALADEPIASLGDPTPVYAYAARLVDREASGLLSSVAIRKPRLSRYGAAGNRFRRVALPGGREREAVSRQGILAAAFDRGRFLYVRSSSPPDEGCPESCPLALSDPVAFR